MLILCILIYLFFDYEMCAPRAYLKNATLRPHYYYYHYYSQSVLTVTMAENGGDSGVRPGQHRLLVVLMSRDLSHGKQTWW